ncbi:MAG TPA: mechanosensitive ion channel domain-containing protein, partial [Castellaniella sp.]|nr:mechanosensitive ion channel domain-containing protein [Castellaniella sp.]
METVTRWADRDALWAAAEAVRAWIVAEVLTLAVGGQLAVLAITYLLARLAAPKVRSWLDVRLAQRVADPRLKQAVQALVAVALPAAWLVFGWLAMLLALRLGWPHALLRVGVSLIAAWVVIRLTASVVREPAWSRIVAVVAWTVAAMNILGVLDEAVAFLGGVAVGIGQVRISLLSVFKAVGLLLLLLWAAGWLSHVVERQVRGLPRLTPSLQLLFGKLFKIGLVSAAVLVALSSIGIDITALAVFTGAVGVGVGFGLQAVISNFVAGIILLLERSLKVGDFVELASGVRGEVREINTRNTVVSTNDNIDIIVPNAEFVNGRVTNWTFRDAYRRIRIPFGVAYGTNKELVRQAGLEAAAAVEHTLTGHPRRDPQVWLVGFGDSSLNFELVVWLTPEAVKRPAAVNAAYCWALETALGRHGIEIPFPQRDLHLRTTPGPRSGDGAR